MSAEKFTPLEDDPNWRQRSACNGEEPELFFPVGSGNLHLAQIEEAKAVCRRCEVQEKCLALAFEGGNEFGIWGGLTEDERRALKRQNNRQ